MSADYWAGRKYCSHACAQSASKGRESPKKGRPVRSIEERFWSKVHVGSPDECWPWVGAQEVAGYGILLRAPGLFYKTHRLSWQLANNRPVPDGMFVCHRCDNPPCVNPSHLFLGTAKDNNQDRSRKGRGRENRVFGESSPTAKISDADVAAIRALVAAGSTQQAAADRFGIKQQHVSRIVRGLNRTR